MLKGKNILICPLEWGLGHAARMIPVAVKLQQMGNNIFVGSGEKHIALFSSGISDIRTIRFGGFNPGYSRYLPQYLWMLFKTPALLYHIIREHHLLKKIIRDNNIDIVISDNRFGLWNSQVTTVYVTHLLRIPLPGPLIFLEFIGMALHRWVIKKYSFCFIPDLPGELNLSGRLSHGVKLPVNTRYIGIISRFDSLPEISGCFDYEHNTVILSGPEPQRGILRKKLTDLLQQSGTPSIFLEGNPGKGSRASSSGKIISYPHLPAPEMSCLLRTSRSVISRSGYTTVMDLAALNLTALLIPTPGQTEQEYLAGYLSSKGWIRTIQQKRIDESLVLPSGSASWPPEIIIESRILLQKALEELLENDHEEGESGETAE